MRHPDSPLTDLDRTQLALLRLYMAAIDAATRAEPVERKEDLNGEATLSGGNLCAASNETEEHTSNEDPSQR